MHFEKHTHTTSIHFVNVESFGHSSIWRLQQAHINELYPRSLKPEKICSFFRSFPVITSPKNNAQENYVCGPVLIV